MCSSGLLFQNPRHGSVSINYANNSTQNHFFNAWQNIVGAITPPAEDALSYVEKHHQDWFDTTSVEIYDFLREKNAVHDAFLCSPHSMTIEKSFVQSAK